MAYVLDRNACGSSSGSGVITSADLAVAAVGTETDGSVVCPSGANANAGIKPTLGLLSRAGIVPISADQDTAGPMARNMTDAAVLLGAMTGVDPADPATAEQVGHAYTDYTQFLDADALEGARIGVWREFSFEIDGVAVDADVSAIMDKTIAALEAAGATVVDPADIPFGAWADAEFPALLCEFKTDIATYLQTYTGPGYPKTLQDLIDFNNDHPELESGAPESNWNSLVFDLAQETSGRDADCAAQRAIATPGAQAAIDDLMAADDLDAIIAPTNGPAWVTDPVNGDLGGDFSTFIGSSGPPAVAGYAERDGAGGLRRAAARRRVVHRRPLGRADADRPRLRVRAGDPCPRPAAVHPVDRRRVLGGAQALVAREAEGGHPWPQQPLEGAAEVSRLTQPCGCAGLRASAPHGCAGPVGHGSTDRVIRRLKPSERRVDGVRAFLTPDPRPPKGESHAAGFRLDAEPAHGPARPARADHGRVRRRARSHHARGRRSSDGTGWRYQRRARRGHGHLLAPTGTTTRTGPASRILFAWAPTSRAPERVGRLRAVGRVLAAGPVTTP